MVGSKCIANKVTKVTDVTYQLFLYDQHSFFNMFVSVVVLIFSLNVKS
jgi:hypothetical protein